MFPTQHPSNNTVLHPPRGATVEECRPLAVTRLTFENGQDGVRSYWRPSAAERAAIAAGALIEFTAIGRTHPPVWVGVDGVNEIEGADA